MTFRIAVDLLYRFDTACEVLLLIEAARSFDQMVRRETLTLTPASPVTRLDDPATGERRAVFTAQGEVRMTYQAEVEVKGRACDLAGARQMAIRDLPEDALRHLRPSRYCPSDRFESFVERQFDGLEGGARAAAILDWLKGHLEYRYGVSDSTTTALDTFVDRVGVCRDFSHLAIALFRASGMPARAVSAYAWMLEPPDMHAVVEVYLGGRWIMLDPTGLAPVDGLVRVATGVDAADIAFMTIFGQAHLVEQSFRIDRLD